MFTPADTLQIAKRGSTQEGVKQQISNFEAGFPYLKLEAAATIGDGILKLNEAEVETAISNYQARMADLISIKFVPASGAASRMFKAMFAHIDKGGTPSEAVQQVVDHLTDFAFYEDLKALVDVDTASPKEILEALLLADGLNYAELPKGLLKFHRYDAGARTPFEEHLVEGANYVKDADGVSRLHFTISPAHRHLFIRLLESVLDAYQSSHEVKFEVGFSEQKPSTDTIAVDLENNPFRLDDGTLLFRPAGHGALIENLNELDADVIFIKNIDNVVPDRLKGETYRYKQVLAGTLLAYQGLVFKYLDQLEGEVTKELIGEIATFLNDDLGTKLPDTFMDMGLVAQAQFLHTKLNRPMRVCGMVKNEGEPGGGPFWVANADGSKSLQIVESAQIDPNEASQQAIMQNATHFNPVDLVCATRDRNGKAFNLLNYTDPQTGFISEKSLSGRELKAQELPGLWNGAMADWLTVFVEVPIVTFNPVKTINDLLRENHQ